VRSNSTVSDGKESVKDGTELDAVFLQKSHTCSQMSCISPQKSPVYLVKSSRGADTLAHVCAKKPFVSAKEPCVYTQEPCISAKEPYISAKEPCMSFKEEHMLWRSIVSDGKGSKKFDAVFLQKTLKFLQKSSVYPLNRPTGADIRVF